MSEKPKPSKAPNTWRGKPGYEHYGEMAEPRFKDGLGRKVGGWLAGLLTAWRR